MSNLKKLEKKVGYVGPTVNNVPREFGEGEHFVKLAYITPDEAKLLKKIDMYDSDPPHTGPEIKGIPNYNDFGGGGRYGGYRSGEAMGAAERGDFGSRDFQASGMSQQQGQAIQAGADLAAAQGNFGRDQSPDAFDQMVAARERFDALNTADDLSTNELSAIQNQYNQNLMNVASNSQLAQVYRQNPNVFTGDFSDYYKQGNTVFNKKTNQKIGTINTLGAMYGIPGVGKYLGMAGAFFGIDPDMPTFSVNPLYAKESGLEREMGGGDGPSGDIMEILYPSEEMPMEEQPIEEQPVMPGYNLAFKDFYGQQLPTRGFSPMRNGGLASLPMNFNPMTNANPFSMMMQGGR